MLLNLEAKRKNRGIALIIVLIVMVTFMILAGGFAYSMKVETKLARNADMDSELEWMGRSGVELARYVLSQPGPSGMQFDALNQKWAGGTGETNPALVDIPLDGYELGNGTITLKISDLDRKFNINVITPANTEFLRQALILIGTDAAETPRIVNAVLDWMDHDDDLQLGARDTESPFYLSLMPPYVAKNGPIDDLTELMLINGITPEMYYGSKFGKDYSRTASKWQRWHRDQIGREVYSIGFVDVFTTVSSGLVNINTASATVLQLLPEVDENLAQAIIAARAGPDGTEGNEDDMPFRSIQELARVPGMPPQLIGQFGRFFTVRSTTFDVRVCAEIGGYKRHFGAVIRREGRATYVLNMFPN